MYITNFKCVQKLKENTPPQLEIIRKQLPLMCLWFCEMSTNSWEEKKTSRERERNERNIWLCYYEYLHSAAMTEFSYYSMRHWLRVSWHTTAKIQGRLCPLFCLCVALWICNLYRESVLQDNHISHRQWSMRVQTVQRKVYQVSCAFM